MSMQASPPGRPGAAEGPRSRGIQSVGRALDLLRLLVAAPGPISLGDLAEAAGMSPSKAHRYLASFAAAGLVSQQRRSGRYDLGPLALEVGLAALGRLQLVNRAAEAMPDLVATTGATALLAVWSHAGPVIVRWERSARYAVTALGLGSVLPLTRSATGQVFLAWLPAPLTAALLEAEVRGEEAQAALACAERVRREGVARVDGRLIPGLFAASVPVLDWQGEAEAALTLIDTRPELIAPAGSCLAALRRAGEAASVARIDPAAGGTD